MNTKGFDAPLWILKECFGDLFSISPHPWKRLWHVTRKSGDSTRSGFQRTRPGHGSSGGGLSSVQSIIILLSWHHAQYDAPCMSITAAWLCRARVRNNVVNGNRMAIRTNGGGIQFHAARLGFRIQRQRSRHGSRICYARRTTTKESDRTDVVFDPSHESLTTFASFRMTDFVEKSNNSSLPLEDWGTVEKTFFVARHLSIELASMCLTSSGRDACRSRKSRLDERVFRSSFRTLRSKSDERVEFDSFLDSL